ncbi:MAG: FAD-dependent oxidoreductase [Imperialibacter sp.]|uniref:FAD-dependent oxidoreductase n=1 Tax=Imperialibacter sp. TaxID=2038411 RepID=UPI0032EE1B9E
MKLKIVSCVLAMLFLATSFHQQAPAAKKGPSYDLVVYGGTSAGVVAAIQVARLGKKAIIIEPGGRLGGAMSGGLGWSDIGNEETIGGISLEFFQRVHEYYQDESVWKAQTRSSYQLNGNHAISERGPMWTFEPEVAQKILLEMIASAPQKIEVVYNERIDLKKGVQKKNGEIKALKTESGKVFIGKFFIDASYEGDLLALADVSYHVGRESRDTYNESLAGVLGPTIKVRQPKQFFGPEISPYDDNGQLLPTIQDVPMGEQGQGDNKIQAFNFRTCLTTFEPNKIPIERPDNYDSMQYELLYRYIELKKLTKISQVLTISAIPNLKTDINDGGHGSPFSTDYNGMNWDYPEGDYATRERIWKEHYDFTIGLFYFLGHDPRLPQAMRGEMLSYGLPKDEYVDSGNWTPQMYIRETRRMIGGHVLTQADCQETVTKPNSIGMASYGPDSHHVQRVVYNGEVQNEGNFLEPHKSYEIPLGVILPKSNECKNLLVPVCVSSSHIAFGSIRMEPVFMIMGQAAGTLVSLAIDNHLPVQEVGYDELRSQLLKDKQKLKLDE